MRALWNSRSPRRVEVISCAVGGYSTTQALLTLQLHGLAFEPDLVLVSAGFDAYHDDPITQMTLRREDFGVLGQWLAAAHLPTAAILEGGYSNDLPSLVSEFLEGWIHG